MPKYRITQTLLSNYAWIFKKDEGYEEFLKCLNREKTPPTEAMLNGIRFENCVNAVLDGMPISPDHEWFDCVTFLGEYLKGSQQQVSLFRDIEVDGITFTVHGILDYLRNGVIFDTKFSQGYADLFLNPKPCIKYLDSPQTPAYFYLVPNARKFEYVICDGRFVYREDYAREDVVPIGVLIKEFMDFLDRQNLVDTYCKFWNMDNNDYHH